MRLYPEQALWDEVTYLAYHLHWDLDACSISPTAIGPA